jgi:penicillin-binding protein 1C
MARERVLDAAARRGVITRQELREALAEALPTQRRPFPSLAPHLADRLRAQQPELGLHRTTIDLDLQSSLEQLAAAALVDLPAQMTVALVVAEEGTGQVLASVGSADYTSTARHGYVDMTRALRSPGSTLKPLVYGLAFSDGLAHPETLLNDRPEEFGDYAPQNFDGQFRGPVTARQALQASLNLPVVTITQALGPARLLAALRLAGEPAVVPGDAPGLAVALGGVGVSLEGLVQLYAAIARGGEARALSVMAGAEVAGGARLMSPQAAWQVADVLAGAPRLGGLPDTRLAVKTGTSSSNRDALALGFDGGHVVGVWVGRADGSPVPGILGAFEATPLLFQAFARLGTPVPLPPAPPGTLTVDSTAELPAHLRQFGLRQVEVEDAPRLLFPPDGAVLTPVEPGLLVRIERGTAPFTYLVNGAPLLQGSYERQVHLPMPGPGFVTLSVLDAQGRSVRAGVEVR